MPNASKATPLVILSVVVACAATLLSVGLLVGSGARFGSCDCCPCCKSFGIYFPTECACEPVNHDPAPGWVDPWKPRPIYGGGETKTPQERGAAETSPPRPASSADGPKEF